MACHLESCCSAGSHLASASFFAILCNAFSCRLPSCLHPPPSESLCRLVVSIFQMIFFPVSKSVLFAQRFLSLLLLNVCLSSETFLILVMPCLADQDPADMTFLLLLYDISSRSHSFSFFVTFPRADGLVFCVQTFPSFLVMTSLADEVFDFI